MEYMLGVALQGDHLILLLEVIKANGETIASQLLDDCVGPDEVANLARLRDLKKQLARHR